MGATSNWPQQLAAVVDLAHQQTSPIGQFAPGGGFYNPPIDFG
jgi:hypothetical protein